MNPSAIVVTVSDGVAKGTRADSSGDEAERMLFEAGFEIARRTVVPDEKGDIVDELLRGVSDGIGLIVTTGGTGLGPRDVTPEATREVVEREVPGLVQLILLAGLVKSSRAALSRSVAGVRDETLVVNLPGSPTAVREGLEVLLPVVPHALDTLRGNTEHG